jgi:hypothetical protein
VTSQGRLSMTWYSNPLSLMTEVLGQRWEVVSLVFAIRSVVWSRLLPVSSSAFAYHCSWIPLRLRSELEAQGPGRFPYSHCSWAPLRSSDSARIPLFSLWLGAIEAQWFWLKPELEAQGPGRFPYSHCSWAPLRSSDSARIPLLSLWLGAIEVQWFRLRPTLEA